MITKNCPEINVFSFKTTFSYTGKLVGETVEQKLLPIKKKLIDKALQQFKVITPCSQLCFQIYDQNLLFYFNYNETTKTLSESLETHSLVFNT